jgi:hypothetical protein
MRKAENNNRENAGGDNHRGGRFSSTKPPLSMPNSIGQIPAKNLSISENPDPDLIPWQATNLSLQSLKDLERRGILRLLYINRRVIMVDRNDWRAVPERLAAERRRAVVGAGLLSQATADALLKEYGTIPGRQQ